MIYSATGSRWISFWNLKKHNILLIMNFIISEMFEYGNFPSEGFHMRSLIEQCGPSIPTSSFESGIQNSSNYDPSLLNLHLRKNKIPNEKAHSKSWRCSIANKQYSYLSQLFLWISYNSGSKYHLVGYLRLPLIEMIPLFKKWEIAWPTSPET